MVRKMTKAEAGRLGAVKTHRILKLKQDKLIIKYNENPIICKRCNDPITYDKRKTNVYCSSRCSAIVNNALRTRVLTEPRKVTWECKFCNKSHTTTSNRVNVYCNNRCHQDELYHDRITNWIEHGVSTQTTPNYARRYLTETHGHKCNVCDITEWNGNPIIFDIDHIDGDPTNHKHTNLRLICQNCHGQTPNYKAKNKGNGRHYRSKRYADGKSY